MKAIRTGVVLITLLTATAASADCNPPPPGLAYQDWYNLCANEIINTYQTNSYEMTFDQFVPVLYQYYVTASMAPTNSGALPTPMGQCANVGETYCPSSHYLLTCNGQNWLTGAQQC